MISRLFEILAIAKSKDRFVIPARRGEVGRDPFKAQGGAGFPVDFSKKPEFSADGPTGATASSGSEMPVLPVQMVDPGCGSKS